MPFSLSDLRRIASDEAAQQDSAFQIVAVTPVGHGSSYAEVIVALRDQVDGGCSLMIGLRRDTSECVCRRDVRERLQAYQARHPLA